MPIGKWDRFSAAFGSRSDKFTRWRNIARETLRMVKKAAELAQKLDDTTGRQFQDDAEVLRLRMVAAIADFDTSDSTAQKAKITELDAVDSAASTLMAKIDVELKKNPSTWVNEDGGEETLRRLVNETDSGDFAEKAVKARFGITTVDTGPANKLDLCKSLYKAMEMVPTHHTRTNASLESLTYKRSPDDESERGVAGVYKTGEKKIVLIMTWLEVKTQSVDKDHDDEVPVDIRPTGTMDMFTGTTVHEVGHAVDHQKGIMDSKAGVSLYGGWRMETAWSTAQAMLSPSKFKGTAGLPDTFLCSVLESAMTTANVTVKTELATLKQVAATVHTAETMAAHAKVREAEQQRVAWERDGWPDEILTISNRALELINSLGPLEGTNTPYGQMGIKPAYQEAINNILMNKMAIQAACAAAFAYHTRNNVDVSPDNWATIERHEGYKLARWVYTKGYVGDGIWKQKKAGATKLTFAGRVYTVSNGKKFFSYDPGARAKAVSAYQFNAPAEWFAELYMFYYGGKLPAKHPAVAFLSELDAPD